MHIYLSSFSQWHHPAEGLHRCLFYSFHSSGHHHKQNWFISGITAKVCISSYLKGLHFTQRYFNRKPNYFELYLSYREDLIVFFIHIPVQTWLLCLYSKSCFTNNLKSFCPFLWLSFSLWSKPCDFYYNKHSYHYYYTHLETISFLFHLYHFIFLLSMSDCHSVNLIIPSWAFTTPRSFLAPDWPTWGRWEIQTQVYQPNSLRNTVCQTRAHCLLRFWGKSQYNVISFILKVPFPLLLNVCMYIYTSESSFTGNVVEPMLCCAAPEKKSISWCELVSISWPSEAKLCAESQSLRLRIIIWITREIQQCTGAEHEWTFEDLQAKL